MDLPRIFFKRHQKTNMGPLIPESCGTDFFGHIPNLGNQSLAYSGNMPYKSFSYPNCFTHLKPDMFINKAMNNFTEGVQQLNRISGVGLMSIFGGYMDGNQGGWSTSQNIIDNPFESILNHLVSKMEITRTTSCPGAFNVGGGSSLKRFEDEKSQPESSMPDVKCKMSYADVAKMNLSNLNKNTSCGKEPTTFTNSSQNINSLGAKKDRNIFLNQACKRVNKNLRNNKRGTNNYSREDKVFVKPYFHSSVKNLTTRRSHGKRMHCSLKRELGTKKNNDVLDIDGSMWGGENIDIFEDSQTCSPDCQPIYLRVRSISSESDCSSELSECLKNPRIRTLSECSLNSIESDDSFIVFDDYVDVTFDESCEEESSSDESDECSSVVGSCNGLPQAAYLKCINTKWNSLSPKDHPVVTQKPNDVELSNGLITPCSILKKVRFACGEALAKVHKLCVWDFAHRAARVGPWEQAARDRVRFSSRITSLAPILNPVLDPVHRAKIYDLRFAAS